MKDVETLRSIGWYRAAFDNVRGMFPKFLSSSMEKKSIACANSGIGMCFFSSNKAEMKYRGFEVLHC